MPTFIYKAKDNFGKTVRDRVIAKDSSDALLKLRQNYPLVLSIEEDITKGSSTVQGKKIKTEHLSYFFRELSILVGAGIPLVRSLIILSKHIKDKYFSNVVIGLKNHIEAGESFANSLKKYPQVFPILYVSMVAIGETSGVLSEVLRWLSVYLEKMVSLAKKIKTAMAYPAIIIIVAGGIFSLLIFKVIPGFKPIFESLGGELPVPTQIVITVAFVLRKFFIYLAGGLFLLIVVFNRYINTPRGRLHFDTLKLTMPILGNFFQKVSLARFSWTLSIMVRNGVPILEAMSIVAQTMGNKVLENILLKVREGVRQGKRIAPQLEEEKFFPMQLTEMISVGEESGNLDTMLEKVASYYEEEVDEGVKVMLALMEPIIILFLGLVVGSIVIAMFLPILQMTKLMGR